MKTISLIIILLTLTFLSSNAFADYPENEDTKTSDALAEYKRIVFQNVLKNWDGPYGQDQRKTVVISFNVSEKGNVVDRPHLKESSQVELLDNLALRAISESAPFPKFPELLKVSNLKFTIHFQYIPGYEPRWGRKRRGNALFKSAENRNPAEQGFGYKDFHFGDPVELVEDLIRKRCSPTKRAFMKGNFHGKFVPSIYTDERKTLDGWCYDKFMHFLFNKNENLTRIIWEVSAKYDDEGVINSYQKLRKKLVSGNNHKLTKVRSNNILERAKGRKKKLIFDEFDNGMLLLVLEIERIQTQIYAIYQDKYAAKNYSKDNDRNDFDKVGSIGSDPRILPWAVRRNSFGFTDMGSFDDIELFIKYLVIIN